MKLREKIEEIFKGWYKTYGFDLPKDGNKEIVDAILIAFREALPQELDGKKYIGSAYGYSAGKFDGFNSCLTQIKKGLK